MTRPTLPFEWYRVTNRMNCGGCSQRQLLPVTKQVIYDHLAGPTPPRQAFGPLPLAFKMMLICYCDFLTNGPSCKETTRGTLAGKSVSPDP